MKLRISLYSMLLFIVLFFPVSTFAAGKNETPEPQTSSNSEEAINQDDVNELNKMSDPKSISSASDDMEDWSKSIPKLFGFEDFGMNNNKYLVFSQQSVSLKPTDPQYGDALVNAFDKAMMSLQEKYLMDLFGKELVDQTKSFFSDTSTNAKEIPLPDINEKNFLDKVLSIFDKGLDVAEKKLDQKLIEMGVEPQELAKMSPKQKKDIFRDKFLKNTMRIASGSIAGLFPIQTNVITDSTGQTVIGVAAIASDKTIQVAKDITLQRKSIIKGKGRDISSLLPDSEEKYIGTLGVRLAYDQNGSPAIISYGISSYQPDVSNSFINDELKEEAKNEAISNADAQIADIINGYMNAKNERTRGEEIKTFVEKEMKPDSDTIEKTITNIVKKTNSEAKKSAQVKLQGISTIKSWRYTDKNGHKFVGAVRVWKYDTLQAVNEFKNPNRNVDQTDQQKKTSYQPFQQSSDPVNTADDF